MTKTAHILFNNMVKVDNYVGITPKVVNAVHDELVVECSEASGQAVADSLVDAMVAAGLLYCKTIPMKVDPVITKIWVK